MAVSTTDFVVSHNANGVLTAFAFSFKILAQTDLRVYLETGVGTGVFTLKTLTTHYTVSFDASAETGTVTFLVAPTSGYRIVITRDTPDTQGTSLDIEGRSPAKTIEGMIDKVTMLAQEALEKLSRAPLFRVAPVDPDPVDIDEPVDAKALLWQDNGDGTWTIVPSTDDFNDIVTDAEAAQAAAEAAQAAAATSASAAASSATSAAASATAAAASATLAATYGFQFLSGLKSARAAAPTVNTVYEATDEGYQLYIWTTTSAAWKPWA